VWGRELAFTKKKVKQGQRVYDGEVQTSRMQKRLDELGVCGLVGVTLETQKAARRAGSIADYWLETSLPGFMMN
jgi:hypothetical protein